MKRSDGTRAAAVAVASLVAFAALLTLVEVVWAPLRRLDTDLTGHLVEPGAKGFWRGVGAAGQPVVFEALAVVAALALWVRRQVAAALLLVAGVLGATLASTVVKQVVARTRPPGALVTAHGSSFPSGHATTSWAAAVAVAVLVGRTAVRAAAMAVAALVGFDRLALGVHYPSDVVAGWLLATAWVLALAALSGRRRPRRRSAS